MEPKPRRIACRGRVRYQEAPSGNEWMQWRAAGEAWRVLALHHFQLPGLPALPLCDHYTIKNEKIARIDNVFDATKLPPMPS